MREIVSPLDGFGSPFGTRRRVTPGVQATGGTETVITQGGNFYRVHTFLTSGDFTVTQGGNVEYLVVAGGGGAGGRPSSALPQGGGGAGGVLKFVAGEANNAASALAITSGTHAIAVGAGGVAGVGTTIFSQPITVAGSGQNSTIGLLVTTVGGGNGEHSVAGGSVSSGGSGGGATGDFSETRQGGSGTAGQGNKGGDGEPGAQADNRGAGGGGGASAEGALGTSGNGGNGGNGLATSISGAEIFVGGGGGGAAFSSQGLGGLGGGGAGARNATGQSGQANTGGGGGAANNSSTGGAGGSGIVIIRYEITEAEYLAEV